MFIKHNILF